jgi:hypothetical protein
MRRTAGGVLIVSKYVRRFLALKVYKIIIRNRRSAIKCQTIIRIFIAKKRLFQLQYEREMLKLKMAQERERAQKRARERAQQYVGQLKAKNLVSNKSAVEEWEEKKIAESKVRRLRREEELRVEREKEEWKARERTENIRNYKQRTKERKRGEKRRIKEIQEKLKKTR